MNNPFEYLNLESFLTFASNAEATQDAFNIQQLLVQHPNRAQMVQWSRQACLNDPDFMEMYHNKYLPPFPSHEELLAMPGNTLGGAYGRHLKKYNISLLFDGLDTTMFYKQDVNELNFMAARNTRNHDIYHVLMGVGTAPLDEYALFCVQLAQFGSPYQMVLLAAGILHTVFREPEKIPEFLDTNHRFYQIGKTARPLISFPYEEHWMTDLNEVRSMMKLPILSRED